MDDERFLLSRTQPNEVLIEARWIAGGSELHRDIFVMIDFAVGIGAIDIKHRRVAVGDRVNRPDRARNAVVRHFAPIEEFKPQDWDRALAVNLSSAFHTTRLALPGMRQRDFGRIVNMASIYGLRAVVNRIDYVTTKTAMIGFTRAVALETAGQNITCNSICPGSSPTPSIEQRFAAFMAKSNLPRAEAEKEFMGSRQPSGRFVAPERIAGLVAFLCGPDGADITGAAISIDGGWSAA